VTVKKKDAPQALLWETGYPYHYLRSQPFNKEEQLVTIGGEDHKVGEVGYEHSHFVRLKRWAKSRLEFSKILFAWSGQIMEPHDYLGYAGRSPNKENEYVITGDSGNGLTHGAIGALVINDLINRRRNRWAKLYDPARTTEGNLPRFAREKAKISAGYSAWLKTIKGPRDLRPGQGAIVKKGIRAEAIFREKSKTHSYSPACTHLRCLVRWNDMEKSFDCPCHGSRFSSQGKIINGPGNKDLKRKLNGAPASKGGGLMIRKVKGGYRVIAESGRNMGTYKTLEEAKKRLRQIEFFKHEAKAGKSKSS